MLNSIHRNSMNQHQHHGSDGHVTKPSNLGAASTFTSGFNVNGASQKILSNPFKSSNVIIKRGDSNHSLLPSKNLKKTSQQ